VTLKADRTPEEGQQQEAQVKHSTHPRSIIKQASEARQRQEDQLRCELREQHDERMALLQSLLETFNKQ